MRLSDLNPEFYNAGGEGIRRITDRTCGPCAGRGCEACHATGKEYEPAPLRVAVGIVFDCPCATCLAKRTGDEDADWHLRVAIPFANPMDGGPTTSSDGRGWTRQGDSFDTLTLTPSILRVGGCGWHGFITNGTIIHC